MRWNEAEKTGATFYVGKVCGRHPGLKGQRRTKSRGCPGCIRERMASPHTRAHREARLRRKEKAASAVERAGG